MANGCLIILANLWRFNTRLLRGACAEHGAAWEFSHLLRWESSPRSRWFRDTASWQARGFQTGPCLSVSWPSKGRWLDTGSTHGTDMSYCPWWQGIWPYVVNSTWKCLDSFPFLVVQNLQIGSNRFIVCRRLYVARRVISVCCDVLCVCVVCVLRWVLFYSVVLWQCCVVLCVRVSVCFLFVRVCVIVCAHCLQTCRRV